MILIINTLASLVFFGEIQNRVNVTCYMLHFLGLTPVKFKSVFLSCIYLNEYAKTCIKQESSFI